jgi:hypothetical protein
MIAHLTTLVYSSAVTVNKRGELIVNVLFILGSTRVTYKNFMKRTSVITSILLTGLLAMPAFADVRELSRGEIRENVRLGKSLSFSQMLSAAKGITSGEVVDVRAFDAGGVYYRILVKRPDGKLGALVLDATTGALMSARSSAVKEVMAAAKDKSGSANANATNNRGGNSSNAGGNNSNAGGNNGNGNGNSGNSGGGNGGGNSGGGNSGGGNGGGKK